MQHDQSPVPPGSGAGARRASPPPARRREPETGRNAGTLWTERGSPMNATRIAKALGERAEEVCRAYLPHGRRQGRYWTAGDIHGARGRSLFVRLTPPGVPGKWTDSAEGTHGDLLDLIRHRMGDVPLRDAMAEARAFLALPAVPAAASDGAYDSSEAARRLWRRCRAIDGTHAEAYLRARAIHRCRFPALRFHPELFYRDGGGMRRLPALVAAVTADAGKHPGPEEHSGPGEQTAHGAIVGVHRTWLDPRHPAKADVSFPRKALGRVHGHAVRFGDPSTGTLLVGEGIETMLSIVTAVPTVTAAAALSAGGLGAFTPPTGIARLVVACDNDEAGERAALRLRRRCFALRIECAVIVSQTGDFNEDIVTLGPHALAARIAPLVCTGGTVPAGNKETEEALRAEMEASSVVSSNSVTRARTSNPPGPPVAPLPAAWPKEL